MNVLILPLSFIAIVFVFVGGLVFFRKGIALRRSKRQKKNAERFNELTEGLSPLIFPKLLNYGPVIIRVENSVDGNTWIFYGEQGHFEWCNEERTEVKFIKHQQNIDQ